MAKRQARFSAEEVLVHRDHVMARLGASLASLQAAADATREALVLFVNPSEDAKGEERKQFVDDAIEAAGVATRGLEYAIECMNDELGESKAFAAGQEPWEEGEEDEDEDEDDDDDEGEGD